MENPFTILDCRTSFLLVFLLTRIVYLQVDERFVYKGFDHVRKKLFTILIISFIVLVLSACNGNENASNGPTSDLNGQQIYGQSCSSCHGGDLRSGYAPDLDQIGKKYSAEEIQDIIENGIGSMPKGIVKGEDAEKVADWLATQK